MQNYLFAYGTLRPGLAPPSVRRLVARLRLIGPGSAPGRLYDLGAYPGAIFEPSAECRVAGDVFELPADSLNLLADLDAYEGYATDDAAGSLYLRIRLSVTLADGRAIDCWAYRYNREVGPARRIESGDYARRQNPGRQRGNTS